MNGWYLAMSQIKRNPLRSGLMAIGVVIAAAVMVIGVIVGMAAVTWMFLLQ